MTEAFASTLVDAIGAQLSQPWLKTLIEIIGAAVLILLIVRVSLPGGAASSKTRANVRVVTEVGLVVGLSLVLNLIKVFQMPQGGSVSLEMIPVFYLASRRGLRIGVLGGLLLGLGQLLIDPYVVHPLQAILDYPLAFAVLGLAGLWPRKPLAGVTVACAARYLVHVISGVVYFASYAPEGTSPWVYSAVYNATYMIPEMIIALVVVFFVASPALRRRVDTSG